MNKAFVREPDDNGQKACPRCGSLGVPVVQETLAAHLPPEVRSRIAASGFFCPFPRCVVAYFDAFDQVLDVEVARDLPYPKDPAAPLCACFGLTTDDVDQDIQDGGATRTRALVQRAKSADAHCLTAAGDGQSCVAAVQKYFMQRRG